MFTTVLLPPGQVRVCELIFVVAYLKIAPKDSIEVKILRRRKRPNKVFCSASELFVDWFDQPYV